MFKMSIKRFVHIYRLIQNYCRGFRGPFIQSRNYKIKLLMAYESVTRKVLFVTAVLAAVMCRGKLKSQDVDC